MTYQDLQDAVLRRVIDAPQAVAIEVPLLVNRALEWVQGRHKFTTSERTHTVTTTAQDRNLTTMPSGFKEFRSRPSRVEELGQVWPLSFAHKDEAEMAFGEASAYDFGAPMVLSTAEDGALPPSILVFPYPDGLSLWPDGEYRIRIPYVYNAPAFTAPSETNWYSENALTSAAMIAYATAEAFRLNWDERRAEAWAVQAEANLLEAIREDKKNRVSGMTTLVPHSGAMGPQLGV